MALFVLLHSPLVGPLTWSLTADELRGRGYDVVVPTLLTDPAGERPFWRQHVRHVAQAVAPFPRAPLVLVGHSGAGPLLPLLGAELGHPVQSYLFVDSDLPRPDTSRLDLFASPEEADAFRSTVRDGLLPVWSEDSLRDVIADLDLRRRFTAELTSLPLAVYEEPLPVPADWPDALCGYIHLSPAYAAPARLARSEGWGYYRLNAGHFHMLVDPRAVADALVCLGDELAAAA